jgi:hypothetical protein
MVRQVAATVSVMTVVVACGGKSVVNPGSGAAGRSEDGSGGMGFGAGRGASGGAMPVGQAGGPDVAPVGGMGGVAPCVYPPVAFELAPWREPALPSTIDEVVARITTGMIGEWYGIVTTPWTEPYGVTLSFGDDGSYAGECVWSSNQCCLALHYGTDDDSDLKRYELEGVTLDGEGYGTIDVVFGERGSYSESGYQGVLENVQLDATFDRLRFDFMYDTFGPLVFDLARQGEVPPK